MKNMRKIIGALLAILLIFAMAGCSAGSGSDVMYEKNEGFVSDSVSGNGAFGDTSYEGGYDSITENNPTADGSVKDAEEYIERKIVYTVTTELQTKDFDAAVEIINGEIQKYGGYIQSQKQTDNGGIYSQYSHRDMTMVVRVPSENLEAFLSGLQNDNMYTLSLSKDSKDYSSVYYDKEIRVSSLKIQEERLLNLLTQAADLKTMLDLEDRLSEVRYEIESLTKEMNYIDSNVDYSTVTIYLDEVVKYQEIVEEPATFFERVKEAIVNSWDDFVEGSQNFVIWLIYAIPTLLIFGVIATVVLLIVKSTKKRNKKMVEKNKEVIGDSADLSDTNK